jgi:hypothetical protein
VTDPVERPEFDREIVALHRGYNEFRTAVDMDLDRLNRRVAEMQDQITRSERALARLDDTLVGVIERMELLGGAFGETFDRLIKHIREEHGDTRRTE